MPWLERTPSMQAHILPGIYRPGESDTHIQIQGKIGCEQTSKRWLTIFSDKNEKALDLYCAFDASTVPSRRLFSFENATLKSLLSIFYFFVVIYGC